LEIAAKGGTDFTDSYRPSDLLVIEGGGREDLNSAVTGLNLGPRQRGSSYGIEISITYTQNEFMHTETGWLGIIAS
jgi:hypothetical protein